MTTSEIIMITIGIGLILIGFGSLIFYHYFRKRKGWDQKDRPNIVEVSRNRVHFKKDSSKKPIKKTSNDDKKIPVEKYWEDQKAIFGNQAKFDEKKLTAKYRKKASEILKK